MATAAPVRAPAHLWIVGLVALLWNALGAFDYVMSQTNNAWYFSLMQFSDADRAYIANSPALADAFWAFGVWGGLLGSILLLMRSRYAYWAFVVSLVGALVTTIYQYVITPLPADLQTGGTTMLTIAVVVIAVALLVYSYRMRAKGVLQ